MLNTGWPATVSSKTQEKSPQPPLKKGVESTLSFLLEFKLILHRLKPYKSNHYEKQ